MFLWDFVLLVELLCTYDHSARPTIKSFGPSLEQKILQLLPDQNWPLTWNHFRAMTNRNKPD